MSLTQDDKIHMKESTKKRWVPMAGALMGVFGSFAALMYLSVHNMPTVRPRIPSASFIRFQQPDTLADGSDDVLFRFNAPPPPIPGWTKSTLSLDREYRVGNTIITYRGLEKRSLLKLDAVIPALDPDYTYKMKISISEAKKGFRRGGDRFVLLSAGKSKIRLLHRSMP
ncbi:MAG: hypothetical protein PVG41_20815 [Desulfobacteraceae bacterium]